MKPKIITKERVQVTLHPVLREKGEVIARDRGLSFSDYLEELIKDDLRGERPSVFDPLPPISGKAARKMITDSRFTPYEKRKLADDV